MCRCFWSFKGISKKNVSNCSVFEPCNVKDAKKAILNNSFTSQKRRQFIEKYSRKKISELIVNDILKSIMNFNRKNIAIIGLGYVGLPLALAFSKYFDVIGFDKNVQRVKELKKGIDVTGEIESKNLTQLKKIKITNNNKEIKKCNIFIVTVPTPINKAKDPDLSYLQMLVPLSQKF